MVSIPIQFFQVSAAAIPTLLVAVVVGLKQGSLWAETMNKSGWFVKLSTTTVSLAIILTIICGEFCAVYALTIGEGTSALAKPVCAAIAFCLLIIALEFLKPILDVLDGAWKTAYFVVIVLTVFIAMMLFWNALPK